MSLPGVLRVCGAPSQLPRSVLAQDATMPRPCAMSPVDCPDLTSRVRNPDTMRGSALPGPHRTRWRRPPHRRPPHRGRSTGVRWRRPPHRRVGALRTSNPGRASVALVTWSTNAPAPCFLQLPTTTLAQAGRVALPSRYPDLEPRSAPSHRGSMDPLSAWFGSSLRGLRAASASRGISGGR
jgi:hypothetical protein